MSPFFRWEAKLDSRKLQGTGTRLGSLRHTVKETVQGSPPTGAGFRSGGDGVCGGK